jgi:hypothetical protein
MSKVSSTNSTFPDTLNVIIWKVLESEMRLQQNYKLVRTTEFAICAAIYVAEQKHIS